MPKIYDKLGKNLGDKVDFEISRPQKLNNCYKWYPCGSLKEKWLSAFFFTKKEWPFVLLSSVIAANRHPTSHDQI